MSTISERKARKTSKTCFETYYYSASAQHENLHQLSVTMSGVTYLSYGLTQESGVSHSQLVKYSI